MSLPAVRQAAVPALQSETAVTAYLQTARDRLSLALEATGPQAVASIRAELATVHEATKQLGLSKDIQLDAQEMCRRAEYALGKAIRKGQAEGTIRTRGNEAGGNQHEPGKLRDPQFSTKASPYDFAPHSTLYGDGTQGGNGIYAMADHTDDEKFEDVIAEAKAEGNLSRANVANKAKGRAPSQTRDQRAEIVAGMAEEGHSRDQIARHMGIGREAVSNIGRDYSLTFPADVTSKTRRVDSSRVVRETVSTLEGVRLALPLVDFASLDPSEAKEWTASLDQSIRALNRFNKQIKETVL